MSLNELFSRVSAIRVAPGNEDPAVDLLKTDVLKYMESRDMADLVLVEGGKPDLFQLDRLSAMTLLSLQNKFKDLEWRAIMAFCAGCHSIECGDGTVLKPASIVQSPLGGIAEDAWIATVAEELGTEAVLEMGRVILRMSSIGKRSKRSLF